MSTTVPNPTPSLERPLIVDLLRAYEGILLGLAVVLLAAVLSSGGTGLWDFAAVIVLPAVLMALFMRRGAPPRRLFLLRVSGALLGWALIWILFLPLFFLLYLAAFPSVGETVAFTLLALLDGAILGLAMAGVDRLGHRLLRRFSAEHG